MDPYVESCLCRQNNQVTGWDSLSFPRGVYTQSLLVTGRFGHIDPEMSVICLAKTKHPNTTVGVHVQRLGLSDESLVEYLND